MSGATESSGPSAPSHPAEVVVVGAGPVGCTAAAQLVAAGVSVLLIEGAPVLPKELRASTFHPSTLDMLAELGVVPDLEARGLIAPRFQYRDRRTGVVAEFDLGALEGETAHPYRLQCEQYKLCEILLGRLADEPGFAVRWGTEVVGASSDSSTARLTLADGEVIEAPWVFAADGGTSAIRRSLGIGFAGMTYEDRYLVLSTPFDFRDHLDHLAWVNYISDPEEWMVLLQTPDLWRALFPIPPGETDEEALDEVNAQRRLQSVVHRTEPWEIAHRTVYAVHQRVADSFRSGRILLAGDAAHINNPLGGMGMNGGIHDAIFLTDALLAVRSGEAADDHLTRCADLRRDLAIDYVQRHTHANAVTLAASDPELRQQALDEMGAKAADPATAHAYMLQTAMITAVRNMRSALTGS